jgi:hypothetical protein
MTSRMKTCGEARFRVSGFLRLKTGRSQLILS